MRLTLTGALLSLATLPFVGCSPPPRPVKPAQAYETEVHASPSEHPAQGETGPSSALDGEEEKTEGGEVNSDPAASGPLPLARPYKQLDRFYDALEALRRHERDQPVRVLWLGDSHTAADFMTQPVREHLFQLGAVGGPGFIRLGLSDSRHGEVQFKLSGTWRKAPILPAQRTRVLDGVFGYGGIRTLPAAGASVTATLRQRSEVPVVWRLSYRLPRGAEIEVELGEVKERLRYEPPDHLKAGEELSDGLRSFELQGLGNQSFRVRHIAGDPQIFGAFVEYQKPGVVLDTVGINGARAATVLAWEPEQFSRQIKERKLELLVLAFGTNEVFDNTHESRYPAHFEGVVERVRAGSPDIPCVIVGPPDSATTQGTTKERVYRVTEVQKQAAESLGCAFVSAFELMGGEGSFTRWQKSNPQKARGDRIHLTIAGYEELGASCARALFPTLEIPEGAAPLEAAAPPVSATSLKAGASLKAEPVL